MWSSQCTPPQATAITGSGASIRLLHRGCRAWDWVGWPLGCKMALGTAGVIDGVSDGRAGDDAWRGRLPLNGIDIKDMALVMSGC